MIFCIKNILKKGNLNFICCDIGHILIGGAPCGDRTIRCKPFKLRVNRS